MRKFLKWLELGEDIPHWISVIAIANLLFNMVTGR